MSKSLFDYLCCALCSKLLSLSVSAERQHTDCCHVRPIHILGDISKACHRDQHRFLSDYLSKSFYRTALLLGRDSDFTPTSRYEQQ